MSKTLAATTLATLALALSACSGGGGGSSDGSSDSSSSPSSESASSSPTAASSTSQDAKASKAIADSLISAQGSAGTSSLFSVNRKQASCVGDGMVSKIGTDKLQQYGLLGKDLQVKGQLGSVSMSATDAKAATGVIFDCTDVDAAVQKAFDRTGNIPKKVRSCVDKNLSGDKLRGVFTQLFEGDESQAQSQLRKPLLKCVKSGSLG